MSDSTSSSPIPLYHQVQSVLRQRIIDGTLAPGEQLPREDDLAAMFGVGKSTIRQAVGELVKDKLVSRQQGRGTFVSFDVDTLLGHVFRGNLGDMIASGQVGRTRLRSLAITHGANPPPRVSEFFGVADALTVVRRTRDMDGVTFGYALDWLPPTLGRLMSKRELTSQGVMQLLEASGHAIGSGEQLMRAALADVEVSDSLGIALGSAILHVERMLFSADNTPLLFVQAWYRSDRYEFHVTFDRHVAGLGRLQATAA